MAMVVSVPRTTDFSNSRFHSDRSYELNSVVCIWTSWFFKYFVISLIFAVAIFIDVAADLSNVVTRNVIAVLSFGAVVKHSPLTDITRGMSGLSNHPNNSANTAPAPITLPVQINAFFIFSPFFYIDIFVIIPVLSQHCTMNTFICFFRHTACARRARCQNSVQFRGICHQAFIFCTWRGQYRIYFFE